MPVIEFAQIKWRPGTPDGLTRSEVRALGLIEIEPNIAPLVTPKRHWSLNLLGAVALSGAVWFAVGVGLSGCATSPASDLYDGQRHAPAQVKAYCAETGGTYVDGAGCTVSYAHGAKSLNPQLQNGVCRTILEQSQIKRAAAEAALRAACKRAGGQ